VQDAATDAIWTEPQARRRAFEALLAAWDAADLTRVAQSLAQIDAAVTTKLTEIGLPREVDATLKVVGGVQLWAAQRVRRRASR